MLIGTVEARKRETFVDPFAPVKDVTSPTAGGAETARSMNQSQEGEPAKPMKVYKPEPEDPTAEFRYKLGKSHFKD
jgi:hypothetical protein